MKKSLLVLPALMLLLGACNGGGGGSQSSSSSSSSSSSEPPAPKTVLKLDFATAVAGSEIVLEGATEKLMSFKTEGEGTATVDEIDKVYEGAGAGGAHENEAGVIKLGTGKANAILTLTLSAPATKVIVNCHSFYALSESYPVNDTNYLKVNSGSPVALPYNATGAGENLEFALSGTTVTFETAQGATNASGRGYFFSLTFIA